MTSGMRCSCAIVGLVLLLGPAARALAQGTVGAIGGLVTDQTGAVLPGATVTIRNMDTGVERAAIVDAAGRYHVQQLALGTYEVGAELSDFQSALRQGITLTIGREAVVNFELQLGELQDRVVVVGEAPLVNTASADVGGLINAEQVATLPVNARSFDRLAQLEVGVSFAKKGSDVFAIGGATQKISIGGARIHDNTFILDGTNITDKRGTSPGGASGAALGMEAIREFRITTHQYNAKHGGSAGGVIEVATKSGTNDLQGSVFYYLRNSALDSRNYFDPVEGPPDFARKQFGGSAGGPVVRNRTFFFASYEGLREHLGQTLRATVPDAGAREGIIGSRRVTVADSVKPYLALWPLPNGPLYEGTGTGEFVSSANRTTNQKYFVVRVDHTLSDHRSLFGRFTIEDGSQSLPHEVPVSHEESQGRSIIVTLENTNILSPTWLATLRAGLNHSKPLEVNVPDGLPSSLDWVPGQPLLSSGQLIVRGVTPLGGARFRPNGFEWNSFQFSGDVTHSQGRHSFSTGAQVQRIQYNHRGADVISGEYTFLTLENFLLGRPRDFLAQGEGYSRDRWLRQTLFGVYAQDQWQVRDGLTLNLGLRYEFSTDPVEKFGLLSNLADVLDTELTLGNPLFDAPKNNLAPRVGIAWDPTGSGKTALRGGFGLFYNLPTPTHWFAIAQSNPPYSLRATVRPAPFPNGWDLARLVQPAALASQRLRGITYTADPRLMHYNLMLERQLGQETVVVVGYIGSRGRNQITRGGFNTRYGTILADGRKFFSPSEPLRNPALSDVDSQATNGDSTYNALVASLRKRYRQGLTFQLSYTFGKALSVQDRIAGGEIGGRNMLLDAWNPRADWGPAEHDVRHTFAGNFTYALPFGKDLTGPAAALLSNWQFSGIVTIASGAPFSADSLFLSGDGNLNSSASNRADLAPGRSGSPILGGPDLYFDPTYFQVTQRGFYGNVARNTMTDPSLETVDLSVGKNFNTGRGTAVDFRVEFFNVLNRANFGTPATTLFDGAGNRVGDAGRIRTTASSARQIQLSLRFTF